MITVRDIPVNKIISPKLYYGLQAFVSGFIVDRGVMKNKKKILYTPVDLETKNIFRVLDDKTFLKYKHSDYRDLLFKFEKGLLNEFFGGKNFTLTLPIQEKGKEVSATLMKSFIGPLAKGQGIDDLQYIIYSALIRGLGIYYDKDTGDIGFGCKLKQSKVGMGSQRTTGKVVDFNLEQVLAAEVEQGFTNKDVGDKEREFAYTHLLRQYAKFELTGWGKQVLINWNKYNILATSRGQGKTFKGAYIATRGLLDTRPGFGGRPYREIKVFVPDKENIGTQFMEYVKSFIGDLDRVKLKNGKRAFEVGQFSVKCNITGNYLKIISLHRFGNTSKDLGTHIGEGLAADLAIIDEAARIPDDFWSSFHQRAAFETQEFFICSTINEETPVDHWFYKLLVDGETGDEDIASYRITIDQNEIMRKGKTTKDWNKQLEKVKEELRKKGDREFYAKGYCIVLEESNVFQLGGVIVPDRSSTYTDEDPRILGFDLGKLEDSAGLSLINLKHGTIESAIKVNNLTYGMQLEYAKDYKKKYKNLLVIGDRSGVGEAVSEQDTDFVVDAWIKSTGQGNLSFNKKYKYYTCSKSLIITTLATTFSTNLLKITNTNVDLIEQLNNFVKMKSGRGNVILYKGKGKKHDDLVLSTAYGVLYMYSILGLKTKEDMEAYVKEIGNYQTYLYDEVEESNDGYYGSLY